MPEATGKAVLQKARVILDCVDALTPELGARCGWPRRRRRSKVALLRFGRGVW